MYVNADPRSKLAADADDTGADAPVAPASYYHFDENHRCEEVDGVRTWYAPGENFIVVYSVAPEGARFERTNQPDEYALLLPDRESRVRIEWAGGETVVEGFSVTFIPPGPSNIHVERGGQVIRFFTRQAADLFDRARSLGADPERDRNIPPLEPWPEPEDGFKVRSYSLDVPAEEGRFGRIFRSTNFMINPVYPRNGPRDRTKLSPHKHDDFQQCSLCLEGSYVHHIRWPWETNADLWREDDHIKCGAPSVAIIPAGALHTSEAVGTETNFLVDIFCPPRADFSAQPGWVLNADDYPAPVEPRPEQ